MKSSRYEVLSPAEVARIDQRFLVAEQPPVGQGASHGLPGAAAPGDLWGVGSRAGHASYLVDGRETPPDGLHQFHSLEHVRLLVPIEADDDFDGHLAGVADSRALVTPAPDRAGRRAGGVLPVRFAR